MIKKFFTNKYFKIISNGICFSKRINRGYVVLMSVLVLGAVGMAVTISVILLGLSSARTSFSYDQSMQSEVLAIACAEEAMQEIIDTSVFNNSGSLSLGSGSCDYTTSYEEGQNITIQAIGTRGSTVKKIKILISTTTPLIITTSWQEVDNF